MRRSKSNLGKPLTMEQLREKLQDQETVGPVVTVIINGVKCNGILDARTDDGICVSTGANRGWLKEKDYGKTWLAYAYHPSSLDMDAWEPCESCLSCDNCENRKDYDPYEGTLGECGRCYGYSHFSPNNFCHECGRPITEEARAELEKRLRG